MLVEEISVPVGAGSGQSRKEVVPMVSREKKYFSRGKQLVPLGLGGQNSRTRACLLARRSLKMLILATARGCSISAAACIFQRPPATASVVAPTLQAP